MVLLKTNVVQRNHIDMYVKKFFNFVTVYLVVMIDQSSSDEFADYLFAGSDKVTILSDYPAAITQEANQFESKKPGLFTKIKDVITGWMSSKIDEAVAPEIKFKEGTYSCGDSSCTRVPGDDGINYEQLKEDSAKTTEPGENDLTRDGRRDVHFVDPPEILKIVDPKDMLNALERGYQEKQRKKQQ